MSTERTQPRRSAFDESPDIYDRARPLYPQALFDDLFSYLDVSEPRALEVGPGTGQATVALLARGARVTGVELGERMAAFLTEKFRDEPRLDVMQGAFEDVAVPEHAYDLVFAATAYHWVEHPVRMSRPHDLLVPGGVLAVVDTNQVRSDVDNGFFDASYPIYLRYRPAERFDPGRPADLVPPVFEEMRDSDLFEDVRLWRYRWDQRYDPQSYRDLLLSYSDTARMEPEAREGLIHDLCEMVAAQPGGTVVRPLVITLSAGRAVRS